MDKLSSEVVRLVNENLKTDIPHLEEYVTLMLQNQTKKKSKDQFVNVFLDAVEHACVAQETLYSRK